MSARKICAVVAVMALGQGCFNIDDDTWDDGSSWGGGAVSTTPEGSPWGDNYYDSEYLTLDIQNAQLNGSMGELRGFDSLAYSAEGTSAYGTTSVQVTIEHRGRYAMAGLSVSGDLTAVEEGTTIEITDELGGSTTNPNITYVSAIACAGSAPGQWDLFDIPGQVRRVTVSDGATPDLKRFDFDMVVDGDTVRGGFEIPDTAGAANPTGEANASDARLEGRLGELDVSGETTWLSDIHRTGLSSLVLENDRGSDVLTVYVDVIGGLQAFAATSDETFDVTNASVRGVVVRAAVGDLELAAKSVHVSVTETVSGYHFDFVSTFATGAEDQTLHGTFDYRFE